MAHPTRMRDSVFNTFGLSVGTRGEGEIHVLNGAEVFTRSDQFFGSSGGSGKLLVDGPGSVYRIAPPVLLPDPVYLDF